MDWVTTAVVVYNYTSIPSTLFVVSGASR